LPAGKRAQLALTGKILRYLTSILRKPRSTFPLLSSTRRRRGTDGGGPSPPPLVWLFEVASQLAEKE